MTGSPALGEEYGEFWVSPPGRGGGGGGEETKEHCFSIMCYKASYGQKPAEELIILTPTNTIFHRVGGHLSTIDSYHKHKLI